MNLSNDSWVADDSGLLEPPGLQPPFETAPPPSTARSLALRLITFAAAGVLAVSLGGLAISEDQQAVFFALAGFSVATLAAVTLITQGETRSVERGYRESLNAVMGQFAQLSTKDWLTGLLVPSQFRAAVETEISRSRRYGRPCTVMYLDPDLARVPALVGGTGRSLAEALQLFVANTMAPILRTTDMLGRREGVFGLAALLPETDGDGAAVAADRVRGEFQRAAMELPANGPVEVPVRVTAAAYPDDAADANGLLQLLDRLSASRA